MSWPLTKLKNQEICCPVLSLQTAAKIILWVRFNPAVSRKWSSNSGASKEVSRSTIGSAFVSDILFDVGPMSNVARGTLLASAADRVWKYVSGAAPGNPIKSDSFFD